MSYVTLCIVMSGCIEMSDAVLHFLPSTAHENNTAQSTANKCQFSVSFFSPFNCCSSVVLWIDKGDFLENLYIVFCPNK